MYQIRYDAVNGIAIADGHTERQVQEWIAQHAEGKDVECVVSTENIIHELRIAVKYGYIACRDIEFFYTDQSDQEVVIFVNRHGDLDHWPEGFCDTIEKQLRRIIGWDEA